MNNPTNDRFQISPNFILGRPVANLGNSEHFQETLNLKCILKIMGLK